MHSASAAVEITCRQGVARGGAMEGRVLEMALICATVPRGDTLPLTKTIISPTAVVNPPNSRPVKTMFHFIYFVAAGFFAPLISSNLL